MTIPSYVLITPAKNEADFIEKTIQSVISQTARPCRWVIVSDGSTDATDEIVRKYAERFPFIKLVRRASSAKRDFGAKVFAFNAGLQQVRDIPHNFIGNLDADISFDPGYYENILQKFQQNPRLGLAGGHRFDEINGRFESVICAPNSVGGPFQLFRKACYHEIGGYIPLEKGGIDAVAEVSARMHGWQVQTFREFKIYHHRRTGTAFGSAIRTNLNRGIKSYLIGYHPLFHIVHCMYRSVKKRHIWWPLLKVVGYTWAALRRYEKPVSKDLVKFLRSEQMARLGGYFTFSR